MDMSIRFPGLKLVLDYVPKSFEIFGFEITIYGVLIAVGMILGIFFVVLEARRNHEDPDRRRDRCKAFVCGFFVESVQK